MTCPTSDSIVVDHLKDQITELCRALGAIEEMTSRECIGEWDAASAGYLIAEVNAKARAAIESVE